jgi:hypothetical protein
MSPRGLGQGLEARAGPAGRDGPAGELPGSPARSWNSARNCARAALFWNVAAASALSVAMCLLMLSITVSNWSRPGRPRRLRSTATSANSPMQTPRSVDVARTTSEPVLRGGTPPGRHCAIRTHPAENCCVRLCSPTGSQAARRHRRAAAAPAPPGRCLRRRRSPLKFATS